MSSVKGGAIRLRIFIPIAGGAEDKPITVSSNFGDPIRIGLKRGAPADFHFSVPDTLQPAPIIRLAMQTPEAIATDSRRLGIKLGDITRLGS